MRRLALSLGLLALASGVAAAQSAASCAERLATPTADSLVVTFATSVSSFDVKRPLPGPYASLLGEGLREQLRLPSPLMFTAYRSEPADTVSPPRTFRALPALSALYGVTLDGAHLRDARLLSGTVSPDFDLAVRNALVALDSSGDLPPLPDSTNAGPLELRIAIARDTPSPFLVPAAPATVPLFRVRLPVREVTQTVRPRGKFSALIPSGFRPKGSGSIMFEMRVSDTGEVDPASVRILSFSSMELAQAVFPRIAKMQFEPLQVGGCPVTSLEVMGTAYESTPMRVR